MSFPLQTIQEKADALARWGAIALGVSLPIATALDGILQLAVLLAWILSARYQDKLNSTVRNPVALTGIGLFCLYAIGMAYGDADWRSAFDALKTATVFLLIAVFATLGDDKTLRHALYGFLCAMGVTLLLSYLIWFDTLPAKTFFKGTPDDPVVFKTHITQNLFMAFAAFVMAVYAKNATNRYYRLALAALCGLALFNVLFMVQGRTGQLVLLLLIIYFLAGWFRHKWAAIIVATLLIIGACAYFFPQSAIHQRTALMIQEFSAWDETRASVTSVGKRLEFYRNSLAIFRDHPIVGVGTGGFVKAYAEKVKDMGMMATTNPHDEYLMIATQLGAIGLTALLFMFYRQWRAAAKLNGYRRAMARGMLIAIAVGGLVSSTLMDHSEGLFYAWMSGLLYSGLREKRA